MPGLTAMRASLLAFTTIVLDTLEFLAHLTANHVSTTRLSWGAAPVPPTLALWYLYPPA